MNLEDYIKFANENKICSIATIDDGKPRVRGFLMWFADETGFYFHTGATKNVSIQLKKNPNIEMCMLSQNPQDMKMLRVSGKVKFLHDIVLRTRLLEEVPFLKGLCSGPEDELLDVFQIYTGEAHFWTMENNLKESEIERVKF
jgi:uncharacterized pyridoxamine 5'-phosphate oxidase family protein